MIQFMSQLTFLNIIFSYSVYLTLKELGGRKCCIASLSHFRRKYYSSENSVTFFKTSFSADDFSICHRLNAFYYEVASHSAYQLRDGQSCHRSIVPLAIILNT